MNLYLISQDHNSGYDTYDSAVVVAEDEEQARRMNPGSEQGDWADISRVDWCWCQPEFVKVELIGVAAPGQSGVICASFNAG